MQLCELSMLDLCVLLAEFSDQAEIWMTCSG